MGRVWILMSCLCLAQHNDWSTTFHIITHNNQHATYSPLGAYITTPQHTNTKYNNHPSPHTTSAHGTGRMHTFYCMDHLCITSILKIALFPNGLTHVC